MEVPWRHFPLVSIFFSLWIISGRKKIKSSGGEEQRVDWCPHVLWLSQGGKINNSETVEFKDKKGGGGVAYCWQVPACPGWLPGWFGSLSSVIGCCGCRCCGGPVPGWVLRLTSPFVRCDAGAGDVGCPSSGRPGCSPGKGWVVVTVGWQVAGGYSRYSVWEYSR